MKNISFLNKRALFLGDSIVSGSRDDENGGVWKNSCDVEDGRGWPRRLKLEYDLDTDNLAIAAQTLVRVEGRGHIIAQLARKKYDDYDYVILEGGYNDAVVTHIDEKGEIVPKMGAIADGFAEASFDEKTVIGSLELLFAKTKAAFPNAKFGYVIPYETPRSTYGGITKNREKMSAFWAQLTAVCEKWQIPVLNLFSGKTQEGISFFDLLSPDTTACLPGNGDFTHLTTHGYDIITPHIAQWLKTL
jgi:lysophospholipase L1-like esterase